MVYASSMSLNRFDNKLYSFSWFHSISNLISYTCHMTVTNSHMVVVIVHTVVNRAARSKNIIGNNVASTCSKSSLKVCLNFVRSFLKAVVDLDL